MKENMNVEQLLAQYDEQDVDKNSGDEMYIAYKKCVDETECGCCTKLCCISYCCQMNSITAGYIICYIYLFGVISICGILKERLNLSIETSRKLIHTLIVFTWVFLYYFFWPNWQVVIVPISFIIINTLSYKFKLFKMIEREEGKDNHKGTIYFAIGITILMFAALVFPETILCTGISVFALCFGDGMAALIGNHAKSKIQIVGEKTLQGSLACIVGTIVGLFILSLITGYKIPLYAALLISIATAMLELVGHGLDNFTILFD